MKFTIVLAVVVTVVYGGNHLCWSVDQISDEIVRLADTNTDGIIQLDELTQELLSDWNLSNGTCLSYDDFKSNWMLHFHDYHDTTHAFFKSLDGNGDQQLCIEDVQAHIVRYDSNPMDGQIQPTELKSFMHAVHPDSHHIGHGNGC